MSHIEHALITRLGPIEALELPEASAVSWWRQHRLLHAETGLWPLLVQGSQPGLDEPGPPLEPSGDAEAWLRARKAEMWESAAEDGYLDDLQEAAFVDPKALKGLEGAPRAGLPIHEPTRGALVPLSHSAELFTVTCFGGWNECPDDDVLTLLMRRWHQLWALEPIMISGESLTLHFPRPLRADEAAQAAQEFYWVCPDTVDQGAETCQALAGHLLESDVWTLWWD